MEADSQKERDEAVRDLTAGMTSGSEAAFKGLYELIFDRLFRYTLVQAAGNEELTKEITQTVLMRLVRYMRPFENERSFWGWLRQVVRSCHIDLVRKAGREPLTVSMELLQERITEAECEDNESEILNALDQGLDRLDPSDSEIVRLSYFEGVSHGDIAVRLATTPKAVESKLARIREKLRRTLLNCLHENILL